MAFIIILLLLLLVSTTGAAAEQQLPRLSHQLIALTVLLMLLLLVFFYLLKRATPAWGGGLIGHIIKESIDQWMSGGDSLLWVKSIKKAINITFMVDIKSFYSNWRTLKWEIKLRGGCGGRSGMTKDVRKRWEMNFTDWRRVFLIFLFYLKEI